MLGGIILGARTTANLDVFAHSAVLIHNYMKKKSKKSLLHSDHNYMLTDVGTTRVVSINKAFHVKSAIFLQLLHKMLQIK